MHYAQVITLSNEVRLPGAENNNWHMDIPVMFFDILRFQINNPVLKFQEDFILLVWQQRRCVL